MAREGAFARQVTGWGWTIAVLAMILLGGTEQHFRLTEGAAEAIAATLIACAVGSPASRFGNVRFLDWILVLLTALVLLQFVPLPPVIWTALPGRELAAEIDVAVFGANGWRPLTLDTAASWRSALNLLPAIAAYLAMRTGDGARRAAVLRAVPLGLIAALFLAGLQAASGQADWTYPYDFGQPEYLTGFFTNHNHHADFLLAALPLSAIHFLGTWSGGKGPRQGLLPAGLIVIGATVAALVLASASRAASALLPIALGATALAVIAPRFESRRKRLLAFGTLASERWPPSVPLYPWGGGTGFLRSSTAVRSARTCAYASGTTRSTRLHNISRSGRALGCSKKPMPSSNRSKR